MRGFLLGKFLPPHAGHLGLCRAAMAMCGRLAVLVCSHDAEPIPGVLRHAWMAAELPGADVIHMHRDIPQTPDEHPDFWPIWRAAIAEHVPGPIGRVFGSEPYVVRLAAELGAAPVVLDPDRLAFPVSGTLLRTDPATHWAHVPPSVRPWFQKRVVTFGPESVGKSTLAALLGAAAGGHVPEYGRTYDRFRPPGDWGAGDFLRIAEGHLALRAALAPAAGPVLVEDTDPLLTAIWARMLTGAALPALEEGTRLADLYLLLGTDAPWVDDGTRYFGDGRRERFMALCRAVLAARGARVVEIGGGWAARESAARAALAALRAEPFPGRWHAPEERHPVHAAGASLWPPRRREDSLGRGP